MNFTEQEYVHYIIKEMKFQIYFLLNAITENFHEKSYFIKKNDSKNRCLQETVLDFAWREINRT